MASEKIRLNVDITKELDQVLTSIASDQGVSKSDVLRRSIALLKASHDAAREGKKVGVAKTGQTLDTEFIGV